MKNRMICNEQLDDLELKGQPLELALHSLAWINKWLGNNRSVIKAILAFYQKQDRPLRIIDLGCGGGDLIAAIAKSLQQHKIEFTITGIDGNENSLQFAQKKNSGFDHIDFMQADILHEDFQIPPCDILVSSHFIYHFSEEQLADFLRKNAPLISTAIIISELCRNRLAIFLFKFGSFLLPISKLAKEDGLLAIKRSFNRNEWLIVLKKAQINRYRLQSVPLFRILLTILTREK